MVLVDSSIWIDFFNDKPNPQVDILETLIATRSDVTLGDLVLVEVLQGTRQDRQFERMLFHLNSFKQIVISDTSVAIQAAINYRHLRKLGVTPRKTIDNLIATRCIMDDIPLLYSDRDFDPFVEHLGLKTLRN